MFTICALIFFSCSTDSSEDLNNESQINDDSQTSTNIQVIDFKTTGIGIFEMSDTKSCNVKGEYINRGESTTGALGTLAAQFNMCTDFESFKYFTGSYTTMDGDQFWFTSTQSGVDEDGRWHLYIIEGGTGKFENATGEITIYRTERFNSQEEGEFTDYGKGVINFY